MSRGKKLLEELGRRGGDYILRDYSEEKITEMLLEMDEDSISLNYFSAKIPVIAKIFLNNNKLLRKCTENALGWLLEESNGLEKIMSDNTLISKVGDGSLAKAAKKNGMWVWTRIKEANKDNFKDGSHLCWAAEKQEEIALDIIKDDEKVKKIVTQGLNYHFYNHEKVALTLINNPVFMQNAHLSTISNIAFVHESCAIQLYEKINEVAQIQDFPNVVRERLRQKYPFWNQENRPLTAEELQSLAHNKDRLEQAILKNPEVVNQQDEHGRTILHYVAQNGFSMGSTSLSEILNVLWATNINFEIQDENGDTPLHRVARTIHERVSSGCTMPAFIREAQRRHCNMAITNNNGHTFIDVLQNNIQGEYFTSRGYRHPYLSIANPPAVNGNGQTEDNDHAFQAAISASFVFQQPTNNNEITERDIVSVNEFLKAELSATHGFFNEELKKIPVHQQLVIIRYLIAKHSENNFQANEALEVTINELDEWKVLLSIENAIKVIVKKESVSEHHISQVRQQYLKNLKECEADIIKSDAGYEESVLTNHEKKSAKGKEKVSDSESNAGLEWNSSQNAVGKKRMPPLVLDEEHSVTPYSLHLKGEEHSSLQQLTPRKNRSELVLSVESSGEFLAKNNSAAKAEEDIGQTLQNAEIDKETAETIKKLERYITEREKEQEQEQEQTNGDEYNSSWARLFKSEFANATTKMAAARKVIRILKNEPHVTLKDIHLKALGDRKLKDCIGEKLKDIKAIHNEENIVLKK